MTLGHARRGCFAKGRGPALGHPELRGAGRRESAGCTLPGGRVARIRGTALPVVLLIASMMLTTSAAWFEASLAAARGVADLRDTLQAFHAADSALTICAQAVLAGAAPVTARVANGTEPVTWKLAAAFAAGAFAPFAQWPGSARPPQCLVEAWRLSARPEVPAYLVTARGFGRNEESQAWLQVELVVDGDTVERHWWRVAARPF